MKKLLVFSITMLVMSLVSFGQFAKSSAIDFDKAEPITLSKLKADYPTQLKKAASDYVFSESKNEGYIDSYLMNLGNEKVEVYVFKDKKSLVSFLKRKMAIDKTFLPGTPGPGGKCDCAGGGSCSCPSDDGIHPIERYVIF